MICLWDRLPDDIQHKIMKYKKEAETKEKMIFWYDLGENIKNIQRMNRYYAFEFITNNTQRVKRPNQIIGDILNILTYYDLYELFLHDCEYIIPEPGIYTGKTAHFIQQGMTVEDKCRSERNMIDGMYYKCHREIFYGRPDTPINLEPDELVEALIALEIFYYDNVKGKVKHPPRVYLEKNIEKQFRRLTNCLFGT